MRILLWSCAEAPTDREAASKPTTKNLRDGPADFIALLSGGLQTSGGLRTFWHAFNVDRLAARLRYAARHLRRQAILVRSLRYGGGSATELSVTGRSRERRGDVGQLILSIKVPPLLWPLGASR
jgi:hypothetical protein